MLFSKAYDSDSIYDSEELDANAIISDFYSNYYAVYAADSFISEEDDEAFNLINEKSFFNFIDEFI